MRTRIVLVVALMLSLQTYRSYGAMSGTLMNSSGQIVAGAKIAILAPETNEAAGVRMLSKTPERPALASGVSDGAGKFVVEPPKDAGNFFDVSITASGYAPEAIRVARDEELGGVLLIVAGTKRGSVTSAGKAVAGATVIWFSGGAEAIATTDADGHYSVPDPEKWANHLVISHPDFALLDEPAGPFAAARTTVDRTMSAGVALRGLVLGEDGKTPVAKAAITVDDWPAATAAEDGTFVVAHAPARWEMVMARAGVLIGARAHATAATVTVKLAKGASVSGTVRNAKTQKTIAGARVRIVAAPQQGVRGSTLTSTFADAKGIYATSSVLPGSYQITVDAPGFAGAVSPVKLTVAQKAEKPLALIEEAHVTGSVLDESRKAVAGAVLTPRIVSRDPMMMMTMPNRMMQRAERPTVSTPDGRFVLRAQPDVDFEVGAVKKGFPSASTSSLHLAPGEKKSGVVLTIVRGVLLTGRVIDRSGKPVSGASVTADQSEGGVNAQQAFIRRTIGGLMRGDRDDVQTTSDGTFSMRIKEGMYDVAVKREGFALKTVRAQQVNAKAKPLEVTLEPGVEISGRVTRAGVGVIGVNVNGISEGAVASATTGPDGSYALTDLAPGQMMVNFRKPEEFIQQMKSVTAPAQNVNVELPLGGRITGKVVDKSSHAPITSFQAGLNTSRSGGGMVFMMPPQLRSFTSDDGTFTLENVPPGQTQLVVNASGYTTGRVPNLTVEDGKTLADVSVEMDTGVRVVGRITGPDGAAVSGASIRQGGAAGGRGMRIPTDGGVTTDPNGEFVIEAIEPGEKTFQIAAAGLLPESKTITLSDKETRLDVQLSAGSRITGQVVTEGGLPVPDAVVSARGAASASFNRTTRTDASGSFQLDQLAPGHYTFTSSKSGYADGVTSDFDISTGAPLRIVLKTGATLYGHVTGLSEADLQHATVLASGSAGSGGATATIDSSGNYRIEGAPSGIVHVSAMTGRGLGDSRNTQPKTIQIDAGSSQEVDLEFISQTVITGRVTRNGQPVSNAMVMFQPRNSVAQTSARTSTDSNGTYSVSGLGDSLYGVTVMELQGMAPYNSTYTVHGSGTFDIDMKSAALRGRVTTISGDPINNARVELRSSDPSVGPMGIRAASTDAGGNFSIDSLAPGSYNATADMDGYGHQVLSVIIGETAGDPIDFKLTKNDGIRLRIVDARDNTALNAFVRAVDMQGRVVYEDMFRGMGLGPAETLTLSLAPGQYRLTVGANGYATQIVSINSPSEQQTIGLTPGGSVSIRSTSNVPRRARLVDANGQPYSRGFGDGSFVLDPSPGGAQLSNVASGSYVVQVLDGSQVLASKSIVVVEGQTALLDL
jgi:uncharacterized GH25 family protein